MIAELGVFFLCWALIFALSLIFVPSYGLQISGKISKNSINAANSYVRGLCICLLSAYGCLTYCFLVDDFSVAYVLNNSSISLPFIYKFCAVWGGHEGSMLLWVVILSFWMVALNLFSKSLENNFRLRVLIVLALLITGFILFVLTTSNPFTRQFVDLKTQGQDLNPLLQDPGFLWHPPILYMGYVGFAVPFAFAIAALWLGQVKTSWIDWLKPWVMLAWCFLTAGITLGSWWAYRELGWGGFWFWDPVENASFMPWLVGIGLIHALILTKKSKQFTNWVILFAIICFALSLIGTFLVRSGVLTSVHAFAISPGRGIYILGFLFVVVGGGLLVFALKAHKLNLQNSQSQIIDKPYLLSRESSLLINNIFSIIAMLTVFIGTLYPLLIDALGLGKLSVGAPYFNSVFSYLVLPILLAMGVGSNLHWGRNKFKNLFKKLNIILLISLILPLVILYFDYMHFSIFVYLGLAGSSWLFLSTLYDLIIKIKHRALKLSYMSMVFAHIGMALVVLGVLVVNAFGVMHDVKLAPGEEMVFGKYKVKFLQEADVNGLNYNGTRATFSVVGRNFAHKIYPEKRIYDVAKVVMTDSDIDVGVFRDIYISLGEPIGDKSWSLRIYYRPLIRFIWAGGILILIGGLLGFFGQINIGSFIRYILCKKCY